MSSFSPPRMGRILEISSVANPRIKSVRALAQKKHRDRSGTFLVEGQKLVRDALDSGWQVEAVIHAASEESQPTVDDLCAAARVKGADVLRVSEKLLTSITRKDNPQSVLGVVRQNWGSAATSVEDPDAVWIALDRVRDPGNLGTIIRTADAAGAAGIVLVGETTDPFSLEATRATMGSIFNVPLVRMSPQAFLSWRADWKGMVVGTHLEGAVDYRSIDYGGRPVLLLMGNEQQGLPEALSGCCDRLVYIPMHGRADSLNLSIATGIMLFHMGKQMPRTGTQEGGPR